MEDMLRPEDVAKLFGVDPKTITRWAISGRLPYVRTLGGHRRYWRQDVETLRASVGLSKLLGGEPGPWVPERATTVVYRIYSGRDDALLYVGITDDIGLRLSTHRRTTWWPIDAHVSTEGPYVRSRALAVEAAAIATECPTMNVGSPGFALG